MLRVVLLAFIAQFPLYFLTFMIPPPGGQVPAGIAMAMSAVEGLGIIYGIGYGVYRLRWLSCPVS